jgi:hypothetical protein
MKNISIMALLMVFSSTVSSEECYTTERYQAGEYSVYDSAGSLLGYIADEGNDQWFIWRVNVGAQNQYITGKEAAISMLCDEEAKK